MRLAFNIAMNAEGKYAATMDSVDEGAKGIKLDEATLVDGRVRLIYKAAKAYQKQAQTSEYDQSVSSSAINTYNDFIALYPEDPRAKQAQTNIVNLRTEQARGAYQIAKFYEKKKKLEGALVYYNEVLIKDASSKYAQEARQRIELLRPKVAARRAKLEEAEKTASEPASTGKPAGGQPDKPAK